MLRLGSRGAAVVLALGALSACSETPVTPTPTSTLTTPAASSTPVPTQESPMTTPTPTPATKLVATIDGVAMDVELYDNAAARDLVSLLPLDAKLEDYAGQEKIVSLPRALDLTGLPKSAKPQVGELGYYAPNRVLVLYYGDVDAYPGIVRLGRFVDGLEQIRALADGTSFSLAVER